jgi:DNA primase
MDVVSVYSSGVKNVIANSGTALTERQIDLIWKFFANPIICLDGDESGQKAALRIAEKLFPLINEKNKIYFSIMPEGKDPDDYIKKNGKNALLKLLQDKQIIQSYIWNYHLSKIDQNNPFEISKFEKEIKKLSYSIKDETLKKYVLEDFLEKIKKLTPIQASKQNYNYIKYYKKKDYQILKETKLLHQKRKDLSKTQIIEFSILFIIMNYFEIASKKIEELSEIVFLSEKNESLKNSIIAELTKGNNKGDMQKKIYNEYENISEEIKENSNIQMITKDKTDQDILELLNELILNFKEQDNLKKIEFLEKELINNLDENSYSELIKLKSQLNRD